MVSVRRGPVLAIVLVSYLFAVRAPPFRVGMCARGKAAMPERSLSGLVVPLNVSGSARRPACEAVDQFRDGHLGLDVDGQVSVFVVAANSTSSVSEST